MKRRIVYGIVTALAIWGCQVEETADNVSDNEALVFTAVIEDNTSKDTRTTLDDNGNVLWKQGDQVSIFAASTVNEQYQVTDASDGKTSAILYQIPGGFVAGAEIDNNVAFYPYASTASIEKRGASYIIRDIALPSTQYYSAASFGNGAFPMAAVTGSAAETNLKFKNLLGGLKLQLKGTATIASISIIGNDDEILCGDAEVTVDNESNPYISLSDVFAKTVTLDCGTGVQLNSETATSFIIALPPMTMTYGFTVVVTDSEGNQMEIQTTKSQTITRSSLLSMPTMDLDYEETVITSTLKEVRESMTDAQQSVTLGDNVIVQGMVISDSSLNNLTSRELYVQDNFAGIAIYCTEAHEFGFGDVLTLDLSNSIIKWYNGYLEIADLPLSRIQKIGHMDEVGAKEISIDDFLNNKYESQYVAIKNAQVVNEDLGKTWVIGNKGTQIGMECSDGSEFVVYSRKTSSYGSEVVPEGSGTIKGISSKYNDVIQLIFAQDSDRMGLTGTRYDIEHEYTISIGEDTRASWSGLELVWRAGDKVYLSDGNTSAVCTVPDNYDGSRTAVVKTRQSFSGDVCCVYPGDAVVQNDSHGSSLIVTVPEDQGRDGSSYTVLYGSSITNHIHLSSRTALINVKLTSAVDDLSFVRITFEGSPIVGQIKIDDNGANVISGTQIAKVAARGDNLFCFSVLPGSITKMYIDVCKTDGTYGRVSSSARTISEGRAYTISLDPSSISFSGIITGSY